MITTTSWWFRQRLKYNKGLILSGAIAYTIYCALDPLFMPASAEFRIDYYGIIGLATLYIIVIIMANIFYTLGSFTDLIFNYKDSQKFRDILFGLGYWSSFSLPILLALETATRFSFISCNTFTY